MNRIALWLAAAVCSTAFAQPVNHDCVLWLRADVGVVTDAANRISDITDGSGAGHHGNNTDAGGRPLLVANALNGRPVMRFAGGQWLNLSGQVLTSQRYTIIAVVNDTRTDGAFREVLSNWNFGNQGTSVFFGTTALNPAGANTTRARLTDDVGGANQGQTGVGVIADRTTHFIFTGISRSTNAEIYQNRTLSAGRETPISTRNLAPPYVIGRQGPISEFWVGDIAEILVYNTDLSRCELDLVYDYLNGRYGIAPCNPSITSQPAPQGVCPQGEAVFNVQAAGGTCDTNFTYRWQRNGTNLSNGPGPDGSVIAGALSSTLTISNCTTANEALYSCIVSNTCASTPSQGAMLDICPGDFNCDGGIDGADVSAFFAQWENGDFSADVNQDGGIDGSDVAFFFAKWSTGC